jgi:hypothetical protein
LTFSLPYLFRLFLQLCIGLIVPISLQSAAHAQAHDSVPAKYRSAKVISIDDTNKQIEVELLGSPYLPREGTAPVSLAGAAAGTAGAVEIVPFTCVRMSDSPISCDLFIDGLLDITSKIVSFIPNRCVTAFVYVYMCVCVSEC